MGPLHIDVVIPEVAGITATRMIPSPTTHVVVMTGFEHDDAVRVLHRHVDPGLLSDRPLDLPCSRLLSHGHLRAWQQSWSGRARLRRERCEAGRDSILE